MHRLQITNFKLQRSKEYFNYLPEIIALPKCGKASTPLRMFKITIFALFANSIYNRAMKG